ERKEYEGELDPIWKLNGHHVPASDPLRPEKGSRAIDPFFEFPIGDPPPDIEDRFAIRVLRNLRTDKPIDGFNAPPAASYVAVDHLRCEPSIECHCTDFCLIGCIRSPPRPHRRIPNWRVSVSVTSWRGLRGGFPLTYPSPADLSFQRSCAPETARVRACLQA